MGIRLFRNIKVLEVANDYFIGAKGYKLYKYDFHSQTQDAIGLVKDKKYAFLSKFKLTRRFFRAEINNLYELPNGDRLIIAKKGIFRCEAGKSIFEKCFEVQRGSRPLNLCITPDGWIYFGEYFANTSKENVNVYGSSDGGKNWEVVFRFPDGSINHIHGIFYDIYSNHIWVVTGDRNNECVIGYTSDHFKTFIEVFRGDQEYRTCQLFFYPQFIVYATDSQYMVNEIKMFDRENLKQTTLATIQGSAIKGGQYGDFAFLSTTVEPSTVNTNKFSHLWVSHNGISWKEIYKAKKDIWPYIMQFGSIEFPLHKTNKHIMFSGRSLTKIDGSSGKIEL